GRRGASNASCPSRLSRPSCPSSLSRLSSPSCPSCPSSLSRPSRPSCPASPSCPVPFSRSLMVCLGIADGMRCVGRPRPLVDADRSEAAGLEDANELQPNHLEQREERHDETAAIVDVGEEIL